HVAELCDVYHGKRDTLLEALADEFPTATGVRWTRPNGGLYVWLTFAPGTDAGPQSRLLLSALREGVLYVPRAFCYLEGAGGPVPRNEARLSFGVAEAEQLREGIRRLARAVAFSGSGKVCVTCKESDALPPIVLETEL